MCRAGPRVCWDGSCRGFPPRPAGGARGAPGRGGDRRAAPWGPISGRLQEGREQGDPHAQLGPEGRRRRRRLPHPAAWPRTDAALTWQPLRRRQARARPPGGRASAALGSGLRLAGAGATARAEGSQPPAPAGRVAIPGAGGAASRR